MLLFVDGALKHLLKELENEIITDIVGNLHNMLVSKFDAGSGLISKKR